MSEETLASFIDAALSDTTVAREVLAAAPGLARSFHGALVLGDHARVTEAVAQSPALATAKGGPRDWEPLLYVCFSRFTEGEVETARALLDAGADPNAAYTDPRWPDNPLPCLYGATGINNDPALARVLLDAGANPNDNESLYHSTEHRDHVCTRLLLEFGAKPAGTNALKHMLDYEDPEGVRILLEAGADPNEHGGMPATPLHHAIWRGRGAEIVALLVDHGADPNAQGWDGRTAYAMAVLAGDQLMAAVLETRGANTDISDFDRFIGACATASAEELDRLLAGPADPNIVFTQADERLLPDLVAAHRTGSVRALLAAGLPVDARGQEGGSALHWACWKGYADLVTLLLQHGASLTLKDTSFQASPTGWFAHGFFNCTESRGDYAATARALLAAGAPLERWPQPSGDESLDAVLRENGLLD